MPPHPSPAPTPAVLARRHNLVTLGEAGRPMVFCHGFGMDQTLWRALAPRFASRNRVFLLDHVGSGGSDLTAYRLETYASLQGYVDDLVAFFWAFDLDRAILVGHSVGAMIGLKAALALPGRISALVMLGASPRYLDDGDYRGGFTAQDVEELLAGFDANREAWTGQMARLAVADPSRPDLEREVQDKFLSAEPAILRQFARTTFGADVRGDLGACRVPTLLLQSRADPIVPVAVSEYLGRAIPGAELQYLDACGHFAQLSAPAEVAGAIGEFLERLPDPTDPGR